MINKKYAKPLLCIALMLLPPVLFAETGAAALPVCLCAVVAVSPPGSHEGETEVAAATVCEAALRRGGILVALFPFHGDSPDIIEQFGQELYSALERMEGFSPMRVDLTDMPSSIRGGLSPSLHPGDLLMGDAPLAITGHISYNLLGQWHARIHLWRARDYRPVFADDLVAFDQESAGVILPFMLQWIFSWIPEDTPQGFGQRFLRQVEDSLLYVGVRASWNIQTFNPLHGGSNFDGNRFASFSAAASVNYKFLSFQFPDFQFMGFRSLLFGPQVEVFATYDFGLQTSSLMIPVLLRVTARMGTLSASVLGGAYWLGGGRRSDIYFSLPNEFSGGAIAGFVLGNRIGPGNLNIEIRRHWDWATTIDRRFDNSFFRRSMTSLSIGYELGFFTRNNGSVNISGRRGGRDNIENYNERQQQ